VLLAAGAELAVRDFTELSDRLIARLGLTGL